MTAKEDLLYFKRMNWHIQANDIDGVYDLMSKQWNDVIEPYKGLMLDNIEFMRFGAHNINDRDVENTWQLAHRFVSKMINTGVSEEVLVTRL